MSRRLRVLCLGLVLALTAGGGWLLRESFRHAEVPPVLADAQPLSQGAEQSESLEQLATSSKLIEESGKAQAARQEVKPPVASAQRVQAQSLATAYSAQSAAAALGALASIEPTLATAAIESALERLCFRVTDGSEPPPPLDSSDTQAPSFRMLQRDLLDTYCADIERTEGSRVDLERALAAIRPDTFSETEKSLRELSDAKLANDQARNILARSQDELSMAAAAIFLDQNGALGVPPHSVDREHPALLNELVADVVGWVRCTELNGCAARAGPVISLCMSSNDCPPSADYAQAMRNRLSDSRWEQALWLRAQIQSQRARLRG